MIFIKPPSYTQATLIQHAAAHRWKVQNGGIVFNGIPIRTDKATRDELAAAAFDAATNPEWKTTWKLGDGRWVELNATSLLAIRAAVSAHVSASFAVERTAQDAILAGTFKTPEDVEKAAWPPNA